jgi:hypothetical protein
MALVYRRATNLARELATSDAVIASPNAPAHSLQLEIRSLRLTESDLDSIRSRSAHAQYRPVPRSGVTTLSGAEAPADNASKVLAQTQAALGGEKRLSEVKSFTTTGNRCRWTCTASSDAQEEKDKYAKEVADLRKNARTGEAGRAPPVLLALPRRRWHEVSLPSAPCNRSRCDRGNRVRPLSDQREDRPEEIRGSEVT